MNWYVTKIIYQIIIGNKEDKAQFDEQFRLIRADELDWAWEKAETIGRMGETIFKNEQAKNVHWKFVAVENVFPVQQLEDGAQLYTQTEEPQLVQEYLDKTQLLSRKSNDKIRSITKN